MLHFNPHTENWGHFVDIKHWPELTAKQKENLSGQTVCIGTVTDPYQPIEAQAGRTRLLLEQLQGLGCSLFIITKSDLIMRDLDLLRTFPQVEIAWSICTLDERFRYDMEPCTIPIAQRFAAMEFFHNQGFKTSCFMAPVFPVFTDVFGIINNACNKCDEVLLDPLNLRCQNRTIILNYVRQFFPKFWPLFDQIYNQGDKSYWFRLSVQIELFAAQQGLTLNGQVPAISNIPNYSKPPVNQSLALGQNFGPNLICHFGKFQNLDNFYRRPEKSTSARAQSSRRPQFSDQAYDQSLGQGQNQGAGYGAQTFFQDNKIYDQPYQGKERAQNKKLDKSKVSTGHQTTLFDLDHID